MGGVIGIDWVAAKILLDAAGIKLERELVDKLQVIEAEMVKALNERKGA